MTPEENLARITEEVNEQMRRFGYILPETNQRLLEAQTGIQNFGFKVQIATGIMGNLAEAVETILVPCTVANKVPQYSTSLLTKWLMLHKWQQ
jgi:septation ring formation regulator EzrA